MRRIILPVVCVFILISCGPSKAERETKEREHIDSLDAAAAQDSLGAAASSSSISDTVEFKKVPVFFATDRNKDGKTYGRLRRESDDYKIGLVSVSIPFYFRMEEGVSKPTM